MASIVQVVTQREAAGAQRVADQLCSVFRARGHRSDVWFLYRKADALDDAGYRDLVPRRPTAFGLPRLWFRLLRELRSQRPDAVIAHTHHAIVFVTTAALVARVTSRIAVHHTLRRYESTSRIAILRVLRAARITSAEIFVSDACRASHRISPGPRAFVIHNGVGPAPSNSGTWALDPRTDRSTPLVVAVGRLARQKDHRTLIEAFASVPDAHLAVIGDGELRDELAARIAELGLRGRVSLVGAIEPERMADAFGAADVVVQPSVWEAFSMVILEAMAAGKPLLVSDIAPHREALGEAARYHPSGDSDALAAGLRQLLDDDAGRASLATAAKVRSEEFTLERMADRYLDLVAGRAPHVAGRP